MKINNEMNKRIEELRQFAIENGADSNLTKIIQIEKIILPNWTRFKCIFGCEMYGKNLCCPPYIPEPDKWRDFIKDYKYALLVGFHGDGSKYLEEKKKINKVLLNLEREAFLMGFPKAFALFAGPCLFCKKCIVNSPEFPKNIELKSAKIYCKHPNKARPSMEAIGIDIFGTIKKLGLELEVVREYDGEKLKHYGLLLIE